MSKLTRVCIQSFLLSELLYFLLVFTLAYCVLSQQKHFVSGDEWIERARELPRSVRDRWQGFERILSIEQGPDVHRRGGTHRT
ncbi:hypothetical protein T492DRAFT_155793 [Pavlovales sp. CCMP2436]|nr:hypothetical protein T492DRAFT_155793 [Pavlovales sp. CCMP2436]